MSFGTGTAGVITRNTSNNVETASKTDEEGVIVEETSYGGINEVTEEVFTDAFANEALNGQVGTTAGGIVVEHSHSEANDAYARATKRTRTPLAAGI